MAETRPEPQRNPNSPEEVFFRQTNLSQMGSESGSKHHRAILLQAEVQNRAKWSSFIIIPRDRTFPYATKLQQKDPLNIHISNTIYPPFKAKICTPLLKLNLWVFLSCSQEHSDQNTRAPPDKNICCATRLPTCFGKK